MKFPFIEDLDDFFCKNYANYDKICILPEYRMPLMQRTTTDEYGRTKAYTLPASTMALCNQEQKDVLLARLKEKMVDKTFSFSFHPVSFWKRLGGKFSKTAFYKSFKKLLNKYKITKADALKLLAVEEQVWDKIVSGGFLPSKNLVFSLALAFGVSFEDTQNSLDGINEEFDYTYEKDVVVAYLLQSKTYNGEMVKAALEEYKVANLFLA